MILMICMLDYRHLEEHEKNGTTHCFDSWHVV